MTAEGHFWLTPDTFHWTAYLLGGDAEPNGGSKRLWVVPR